MDKVRKENHDRPKQSKSHMSLHIPKVVWDPNKRRRSKFSRRFDSIFQNKNTV